MFAKNIQKPRVPTSGFAVFIRFNLHNHSCSHFTLCYTSRQCYTIIHHVYIYEFSRRISENPQSETRPPSSPHPPPRRGKNQRRRGESIPPDKLFRPASSAFLSKKVRANAKITPPNETLSELRKRSDFAEAKIALSIFSKPFPPTAEAVNSQSSPQLHESVLSLRMGFEPIFWKNSFHAK